MNQHRIVQSFGTDLQVRFLHHAGTQAQSGQKQTAATWRHREVFRAAICFVIW